MSAEKPKIRLNKKQKAEKYGKKFKKDYLEFNKEWLGGSLEGMKKHVEASERITEQSMGKREADDPILKKYNQRKGTRVADNLGKMLAKDQKVIVKSLNINKNTLDPSDMLRRDSAFKAKTDNLKGYVTLYTNYGPLHLEIFSGAVPTAAENFLGLCRKGYYTGLSFHRLIPGFMVQGGDPTKTGAGGESLWGAPFQDEFTPTLSHNSRGVLSMANSGPSTNGSQFFITFGECKGLDGNHTVFGKMTGGMDSLDSIEAVPTASSERPEKEIKITDVAVHWDPFEFLRKTL